MASRIVIYNIYLEIWIDGRIIQNLFVQMISNNSDK